MDPRPGWPRSPLDFGGDEIYFPQEPTLVGRAYGEALHALSKRHDISRQLIRIWAGKFEAGVLDDDVQAADLLQEYEAKIAALERMVGRQALEIEMLKGALKHAPRPKSANASVVTGPVVSRSAGDAN